MSAPVHARTSVGKGRTYVHPVTGEVFPSVTAILGVALAKPALVGWAARTVAEEAVRGRRELWGRAELDEAEAIKWLKGRPYADSRNAADLGSRLHALAEGHALDGVMRNLHDDERGMVKSYLQWVKDWQPTFEATEITVLNRRLGYAGTLDGIVRLPGIDGLTLIDYKTGKTGPYPEWALQLAGYAHAETVLLPDGSEQPMPEVAHAAVLRIRPNFYALHQVIRRSDELLAVFEHMVAIATWAGSDEDHFSIRLDPPVTATKAG